MEHSLAGRALDYIGRLYGVEAAARGMTPERRQHLRQKLAKPILNELHRWLLDLRASVVPKGLLGRAIRYTLDEWERLVAYVDDGHVEIDNNACEREIKQVVMGRKAWLFADTPDGARANAVLYSLVRTAIANDMNRPGFPRHS
ncbi:MAG: transposase [Pseudomonadota bacterium]